jgi:chaperonin GroEL
LLLVVVLLLLRAKSAIKADNADEATGTKLSRAVESPLRTIVENAGLEGSLLQSC